MAPLRTLSLQVGDVLQILNGREDSDEVNARVREAKDEAHRTGSAALVIGGWRADPNASVVIDYTSGEPKIVKNRRGPTDN